jgi:broad specificity phosphatase PhoE
MGEPAIRIILARHGETEWNRLGIFQGRSDIPLNPQGIAEAHALAVTLKNEPLSAIYCSPLVRAKETARIIQQFHPSVSFVEKPGLVEMDLGDFDGMKASDWAEQFPKFRKVWQKKPASLKMPGGESLQDVQKRALGTIRRIAKQHSPGETLLACSHNFTIISLRCLALNISLDDFRKVKQKTGSFHTLYWQKDIFTEQEM